MHSNGPQTRGGIIKSIRSQQVESHLHSSEPPYLASHVKLTELPSLTTISVEVRASIMDGGTAKQHFVEGYTIILFAVSKG